jgi:adenine/guanine phosphoribosyltransferase-like PRPP-binding protein
MRCAHCPRLDAPECRGEIHPRDCELTDPSHPDYRSEWADILNGKAPRDATPPPDANPLDQWSYITTAQLADDTRRLLTLLPDDIDTIAAISRSGLLPGSLLAYHLHLPMLIVSRQTGVTDPGHGARLASGDPAPPRHILLLDDTAASGREMTACLPILRAAHPSAKITRAVVYCRPEARHAVDLYARAYPGLHYLEWNWPNAGHGTACAFDFDGILCRDFTAEEVSTEDRYRSTMVTIEPLFLPRRAGIPLIVTARPESTRELTLAWLARHGVRVDRLIMRDWEWNPATDWNASVGEWKARHYAASHLRLFAESDPDQARIIAEKSGKAVLCPSLGRVIPPAPKPTLGLAENIAAHQAVKDCPHRTPPECGCPDEPSTCGRPDMAGQRTLRECLACVKESK